MVLSYIILHQTRKLMLVRNLFRLFTFSTGPARPPRDISSLEKGPIKRCQSAETCQAFGTASCEGIGPALCIFGPSVWVMEFK